MTFKTRRLILILLGIVYILSVVFFSEFFLENSLGRCALIIFFVAYFILNLAWWRCDKCGKYLGKLSIFAKHCPFCGDELE